MCPPHETTERDGSRMHLLWVPSRHGILRHHGLPTGTGETIALVATIAPSCRGRGPKRLAGLRTCWSRHLWYASFASAPTFHRLKKQLCVPDFQFHLTPGFLLASSWPLREGLLEFLNVLAQPENRAFRRSRLCDHFIDGRVRRNADSPSLSDRSEFLGNRHPTGTIPT